MAKPKITDYQNVHVYLQSLYSYRKASQKEFSYAVWAKELGISNRVYLRSLVLGERPINERILKIFIKGLGFSKDDKNYFVNLVHYNQSKSSEQRSIFAKNILKIKIDKTKFKDVSDHYEFLADDLLPRLLTLLSFEDVPQAIEELAELLGESEDRVRAGLERLLILRLVQQSQNGAVRPIKRSWKATESFNNIHFRDFYHDVLRRAKDAIDQFPAAERRYRNLFVAMSPEEFEDFQRDFESFVQEQLEKRNVDHLSKRRLYYLNFNFFPGSNIQK